MQRMTPCDVVAFVDVFGQFNQLRTSFCCTFLAAWLKDPAAVKAFVAAAFALPQGCHDGCRASADDMFKALVSMVKRVDGPSNKVELEQTTRQGPARFMGARIVCRLLKVVTESPEEVGLVVLGIKEDTFYVAQRFPSQL